MAGDGMVNQSIAFVPASIEEVSEVLRSAPGAVFVGSTHPFGVPLEEPEGSIRLSLDSMTGIVEHDVSDQVVVVRAGTWLSELQAELAKHGQCLPFAPGYDDGALAELIGFNLPHRLHAQCGSWRDWILGMKVVQADGTIAKCGSKAVKNVAGYDVQKLMIGARGTLAVICEVTFKTYPLEALPTTSTASGPCNLIQRVLRTDFDRAVVAYGSKVVVADKESSTLWVNLPDGDSPVRFAEDWVIRAKSLEFADPTQARLMRRAKDLFDPMHKLNPGAMGIF